LKASALCKPSPKSIHAETTKMIQHRLPDKDIPLDILPEVFTALRF